MGNLDNIRTGAPYNDPTFEALCRAHDIWGTEEAALCAAFWETAKRQQQTLSTHESLAQRLREHAAIHEQHVPHDDEQTTWAQDLRAAADIISTARMAHPDEAVFRAAILDLASISEALGIDPDAGGAAPILDAIEQLRAAWPADSAALHDVVTAAQDLGENSEEIELDDGVGRAAGLRHWHALDDALENLADTLAKPRTCNNEACGWTGTTRRMLGTVGPLCPECGETTEEVARAAKGSDHD